MQTVAKMLSLVRWLVSDRHVPLGGAILCLAALLACAGADALAPRDPSKVKYSDVPLATLASEATATPWIGKDVATEGVYALDATAGIAAIAAFGGGDARPPGYEDYALIILGNLNGVGLQVLAAPSLQRPKSVPSKTPASVRGRLIVDNGRMFVVADQITASGAPRSEAPTKYKVPGGLEFSWQEDGGTGSGADAGADGA